MNDDRTEQHDSNTRPTAAMDNTMGREPCPAWCVENHTEAGTEPGWHSGRLVELAGSDGTAQRGFWGWATQDPGKPIMFEIEAPHAAITVDADDLARILAATATEEARAALVDALAELGITVPS